MAIEQGVSLAPCPMAKDLAILIPARQEEFLAHTIQDILENIEADTEVIAVLDGAWADPQILQYERVNIIYVPEAIGQRRATNLAARLSKAKYVMKTDAHCAFDKGFDRKMIEGFEKVGDNCTMVPIMKNLHVYDWKCYKCGKKVYQDVVPICPVDGEKMKKKMIWQPRRGTNSRSYAFDSEPHFQYFQQYRNTEKYKKELESGFTETMSLQGSCWMLSRERYLEYAPVREELGSWGSEGIEMSCREWLSGGKCLVNHNTWYAHCFRTKGNIFGFPYPQSGRDVHRTKARVWDMILNGRLPNQKYPVSWQVERFWPVSGWNEESLKSLKEKEVKP